MTGVQTCALPICFPVTIGGHGIVEKQAPLLAGQAEWYVVSQLNAFKNGLRKNEAMMPFLKDLTEQDFKDVAEYIKLLRVTAKP